MYHFIVPYCYVAGNILQLSAINKLYLHAVQFQDIRSFFHTSGSKQKDVISKPGAPTVEKVKIKKRKAVISSDEEEEKKAVSPKKVKISDELQSVDLSKVFSKSPIKRKRDEISKEEAGSVSKKVMDTAKVESTKKANVSLDTSKENVVSVSKKIIDTAKNEPTKSVDSSFDISEEKAPKKVKAKNTTKVETSGTGNV